MDLRDWNFQTTAPHHLKLYEDVRVTIPAVHRILNLQHLFPPTRGCHCLLSKVPRDLCQIQPNGHTWSVWPTSPLIHVSSISPSHLTPGSFYYLKIGMPPYSVPRKLCLLACFWNLDPPASAVSFFSKSSFLVCRTITTTYEYTHETSPRHTPGITMPSFRRALWSWAP